MGSIFRGIGYFLGGLLVLIFFVVLERTWLIRSSLPTLEGTLEVESLTGPVDIVRDREGVPHIFGSEINDVYYGLGVAHAQDRLWQMEFIRRVAQGRLSEILGNSTVSTDEMFRALDFSGSAKASFELLSEETRGLLTAYAAGVNSIIEDSSLSLPPEFTLLYHRPEPWLPHHSLLISKMMSVGLSTNMFSELERAKLIKRLGEEKTIQFFPGTENLGPIMTLELRSLYNGDAKGKSQVALDPKQKQYAQNPLNVKNPLGLFMQGASNNWVVDGTRTESGKPLLANDPHLSLTSPSVWYLAHLSMNGRNVIGGTLPGLPMVVLGRNDSIAWGFTNTGADVQDLYIEQINPDNPDEYRTPDGFAPFEKREEVIKVRFGADKKITVRGTRHGPVMPENWLGSDEILSEGHVLSLAWTALSKEDTTVDAGLGMMSASSWYDFQRAAEKFQHPMQNMVYADVRGNIGYIAPAKVPIRKAENDLGGLSPAPGWLPQYDWDGFIPFDQLPKSFNPEGGAIHTANNKIVDEDYPFTITRQWEPDFRAKRIEALLWVIKKHNFTSFQLMHADTFSPFASSILPFLKEAEPASETGKAALALLNEWKGHMDANKAEPLIFAAWIKELSRLIYADDLGDQFKAHWIFKPEFIRRALAGEEGMDDWCDDQSTEDNKENCQVLLDQALDLAVEELARDYGPDIEAWKWGTAHRSIHKHNPFDRFPYLRDYFSQEVDVGGGFYTLNRAGHWFSEARPYASIHGSGYRAIYDMSNPDSSLFIQTTGQSGNPLSSLFDTYLTNWADLRYIPMSTQRDQAEESALGTLSLTPPAGSKEETPPEKTPEEAAENEG